MEVPFLLILPMAVPEFLIVVTRKSTEIHNHEGCTTDK